MSETEETVNENTEQDFVPQNIKVSIIIPFNNVESYIGECLDSVLSQTLKEIEVILINDASTDNTRAIAQQYADNDSRIKIIDVPQRSGQGYARNRGFEIAQGEYIGFVDSDDFIEPDMFETLYNRAKQDDLDITMCQVREYDDMNKTYSTSDYYALDCLSNFGDSVFSAEDTKDQLLNINVALWNKIYKSDYFFSINEKFPEGFIYEDLPFFFGTYTPAKRMGIVWKNLYSYRVNRKNSTMQQFNNKILDRPPMVSLTYEKLKKLPYFPEIADRVKGWIIDDLFHRFILLKENYHQEFFFLMKKIFEGLDIQNPQDKFWKRIYHFQGYLLVINNNYEDFNKKVFNIYTDFHKLEDIFESKTLSAPEIIRRIDSVYKDMGKTYEYTNFKASELRAETDGKISQIYNEISKNYEYTKNIVSEEIQKVSEPLYNDIKDLSYVLNNNFSDITKEQFKLKDEIKQELEEIKNNNENQTATVYNDLSAKFYEVSQNITDAENKIDEAVNNINNTIQEEKQTTESIVRHLRTEFMEILETQQAKHNEEIAELKEQNKKLTVQLQTLEQTLTEELNTPLIKMFLNKKNKSEK